MSVQENCQPTLIYVPLILIYQIKIKISDFDPPVTRLFSYLMNNFNLSKITFQNIIYEL